MARGSTRTGGDRGSGAADEFAGLLAFSADAIVVVDRAGKIVAANALAEQLFGYGNGELCGLEVEALVPERLRLAHAGRRAAGVSASHARSMGAGLTVTGRRKNGTEFPAAVALNPTDAGGTGVVLSTVYDITDRVRTEAAARHFEALVQSSDDAIVSEDVDLRITTWNSGAERLYGYGAAEAVGRRFSMLIPPEREGEERTIIGWILKGETIDHFDTTRLHKDGRRLDVSVTVSAIRNLRGDIVGASSIARDISAAKAVASAHDQIVERLLLAAESRDGTARDHLTQMSQLCGEIAASLGWDTQRVRELTSAAALHDIGKIAIPDAILRKPGPLTEEERAAVQTHAVIGHRMLAGTGIPVIELAAEIALTHHEHFDGSGYPQGLKGDAIPISGRIAAVADVFDALTNDRVYRPALTRDEALATMRADSGTHFDPDLLNRLFEMLLTEKLARPTR